MLTSDKTLFTRTIEGLDEWLTQPLGGLSGQFPSELAACLGTERFHQSGQIHFVTASIAYRRRAIVHGRAVGNFEAAIALRFNRIHQRTTTVLQLIQ